MSDFVLQVELGGRTVGVERRGEALVFGDAPLERFTPSSRTIGGRTVVAGCLPPGAERVVVIDDRGDEFDATAGDGVYLAVAGEAGFSEPLVRFTDASGALIALPLPDGPRTRVQDAPEPCPVCAAVAWAMVASTVLCERCGHVAGHAYDGSGGTIMIQEGGGGDEVARSAFDAREYLRRQKEALAAVPFPVYAVPGRAASAAGRYGGTGEVRVAHDPPVEDDRDSRLSVATGVRGEARLQEPRDALVSLLEEDFDDRDRSLSGALVGLTHRERSARRRVARAEPVARALVIDGQPEPFEFVGIGDAWVATRDHGDVQVMVSARAIDPADVALEPLVDPANAQAGTLGDVKRAAERARRDAAGELLTRAEVERLIDRHALAAHRDKVLAAIRPGYWLLPGDAPRTRIGGLPDLAAGERWPHGDDGIPYTFVAQIDCSVLPPMVSEFALPEWGHGDALVRIFAALDARVPEPGPAVALACPADAPVARAELPPRPDPLPVHAWEPDDDSLRGLHELPVRLVPFLSARVAWYADIPAEASESYDEFARRLAAGGDDPRDGQWQIPHLLGHGETLQGEDPASTGEFMHPDLPRGEWCTLINIPDHQGMSFGDGGGLAIVIPIADLAAGRYDRLVTDPSMY